MSLTDEQATALYQSRYEQLVAPTSSERVQLARQQYERLVEAGWTIEPPKPRHRVEYDGGFWKVHEGDRNLWIASFEADSHPDAEAAAQAEADRLNRGAA